MKEKENYRLVTEYRLFSIAKDKEVFLTLSRQAFKRHVSEVKKVLGVKGFKEAYKICKGQIYIKKANSVLQRRIDKHLNELVRYNKEVMPTRKMYEKHMGGGAFSLIQQRTEFQIIDNAGWAINIPRIIYDYYNWELQHYFLLEVKEKVNHE